MKLLISQRGIEVYEEIVGIEPCPSFIKMYIVLDLESKKAVVVDPGPASRYDIARSVIENLKNQGIDVSYILITHIHVDHYGAGPRLSKHFGVPMIVHPRAVKHVIDPTKLWQLTLRVLGTEAEALGRPEPLGEELVKSVDDGTTLRAGRMVIKVVHTPGHAPHHQVYVVNDVVLFSGDAAGGYCKELDIVYPTSPPGLRLDLYMESLKRMESLAFEYLAPTHMDIAEDGKNVLSRHYKQMELWRDRVIELLKMERQPALENIAEVDNDLARFLEASRRGGVCQRIELSYRRSLEAVVAEVKKLGYL